HLPHSLSFCFCACPFAYLTLHSFPTRRSSDLSLKLRCVDQTHHQFAFVSVCAKANNVMDRISVNSFGQRKFLVDMDSIRDTEFIDRKSTRLNSSHGSISYAVFCLKKKI